jgi:hypothetical protein
MQFYRLWIFGITLCALSIAPACGQDRSHRGRDSAAAATDFSAPKPPHPVIDASHTDTDLSDTDTVDADYPDSELTCQRGFAGAVGIFPEEEQPLECDVLFSNAHLDCVARRTECGASLQCPDALWNESQWTFDELGQAEATLISPTDDSIACTGQLTPEGYDMEWVCMVGTTACTGTIRSYFE